MKEKILCIQLKQIGDVLMITPAIRSLAESRPEAEIHILTQTPSSQIFEHNPHIAKIHIYPAAEKIVDVFSLIRRLRKEAFSTVIDFFGLPKTALLARLSGAPARIGFDRPGRSIFYSHPVKTASTHSYSALKQSYLLTVLGIDTVNPKLDFFIGPEDEAVADRILEHLQRDPDRPLISVSPVSRKDYKVWPAENFAHVCDFLIERYNAQILFLWGPGEYYFVEAVRGKMKYEALADYDIPTLRETVGLLKRVDLHIGNDNGPMHFAIAAGTRTAAVFGRPLMRNWTPPDQDQHMAVEFDPGCKEKCHYPKCELACIRDLQTEPVVKMAAIQIEDIVHGRNRKSP